MEMENQDFFRYRQQGHYLHADLNKQDPNAEPNELNHLITQAYTVNTKFYFKLVLRSYNSWQILNKLYFKKWIKELKVDITEQQWVNKCKMQSSTTGSKSWRELSWKVLTRYFITPKIKTQQTSIVHTCWSNYGHRGEPPSYIL